MTNNKNPKTINHEDIPEVNIAPEPKKEKMLDRVKAFGSRHKNKFATAAIGLLSGAASGLILAKNIDLNLVLEGAEDSEACPLAVGESEDLSKITETPNPTDD